MFYFDCSRQYLYPLLLNFIDRILLLALPTRSDTNHRKVSIILSVVVIVYTFLLLYSLIVGNSGTTFIKLNDIYCNYGYYGLIHLTEYYTYYSLLDSVLFQYISNIHKKKQHIRCIIWHTYCKYWIWEWFEVQANP